MRLMKHKNRYQQNLAEYKERFRKLREEYGYRNGIKMPEDYNRKAYKLKKRMDIYRQAIKRHETHEENIIQIDLMIIDFIGVSAFRTAKYLGVYRDARNLFFTVGMESGIKGPYLSKYVGVSGRRASEARMEFKRSLNTNIYNRELWNRWKQYIKEQQSVNQAA